MNLYKLFKKGIEAEKLERARREAELAGSLRGGNTGYMVNGQIHGRCAREAVLRYFGVDKDFSTSLRIQFAMAEYAETMLIEKFGKATDLDIMTQDECSIEWDCGGMPVKCSPDIVFANQGTPTLGVEVKMISSIWTLRNVTPFSFIPGKPNADHLCQAAHYSRKLGQQNGTDFIPWKLLYICPVGYHAHTKDLRESSYNSEFLKRQDYGKREVFKIESHMVTYDMTFDSTGRVLYRLESEGREEAWTSTPITAQGIEDYYNVVAECVREKKMPPRMKNTDLTGKALKWQKYSKTYNDYADLHDAYDVGSITFDQFIDGAKKL